MSAGSLRWSCSSSCISVTSRSSLRLRGPRRIAIAVVVAMLTLADAFLIFER
jgi:hypothetical protein